MAFLSAVAVGFPSSAATGAPALGRWVLGGGTVLAALVFTHAAIVPGFPAYTVVWKGMPFLMGVPAAAILFAHLANRYFLQGVGGLGVGKCLRLLVLSVPKLLLAMCGISLLGVAAGAFAAFAA